MKEIDKMISGHLYKVSDGELVKHLSDAKDLCDEFNFTSRNDYDKRKAILIKLLHNFGDNILIESPFYCDYGFNITIGDNFYANHGLTILDGSKVKIENNVFIGPNVGIYTATHPISAKVRKMGYEYAKSISIGNDVWIGGGSIINPGVNIGNNVVIGSGSVVTKDIPSNVVAVGNPCKVIRNITNEDDSYWENLIQK
ncbi:MAG: sugar O-acetyltransferase [Bacilli bacterium]|nr:sugar O-acetyltransferase [Bacilli bacterium]